MSREESDLTYEDLCSIWEETKEEAPAPREAANTHPEALRRAREAQKRREEAGRKKHAHETQEEVTARFEAILENLRRLLGDPAEDR